MPRSPSNQDSRFRGIWVAQWVKHQILDLAQVMISWFVSSNPTSGCMLTTWSLLGILSLSLSLSLSAPTLLMLSLKINTLKKTLQLTTKLQETREIERQGKWHHEEAISQVQYMGYYI